MPSPPASAKTVVGDPRNETVRMGPVVSKSQQKAVLEALARLKSEAKAITGEGAPALVDADAKAGCFIAPTLLRCDTPAEARVIHEVEAFGPVSTVMPYDGADQAFALARKGGGSLAASVFTSDAAFAAEAVAGIGCRPRPRAGGGRERAASPRPAMVSSCPCASTAAPAAPAAVRSWAACARSTSTTSGSPYRAASTGSRPSPTAPSKREPAISKRYRKYKENLIDLYRAGAKSFA